MILLLKGAAILFFWTGLVWNMNLCPLMCPREPHNLGPTRWTKYVHEAASPDDWVTLPLVTLQQVNKNVPIAGGKKRSNL